MMKSARPLNLAVRHVAPQTPLHRNDSAIESQLVIYYQPRQILRCVNDRCAGHSALTMQPCTPCKQPGLPYICRLMRHAVKANGYFISSFGYLGLCRPTGCCISPRSIKRTRTERSNDKPPV